MIVTSKNEYGYVEGFEIYEGYARMVPHKCAVRERNNWQCCLELEGGTVCPRHGQVKVNKPHYDSSHHD